MEDDPNLFRQYAAECRRLADHTSEKDRAVLLEIADAWLSPAADRQKEKCKPEPKTINPAYVQE
jgi:hypothetical protein